MDYSVNFENLYRQCPLPPFMVELNLKKTSQEYVIYMNVSEPFNVLEIFLNIFLHFFFLKKKGTEIV